VIGKIYEGELGEDPFGVLKTFVIEVFGKCLSENNII
jgi:hypothetical protein